MNETSENNQNSETKKARKIWRFLLVGGLAIVFVVLLILTRFYIPDHVPVLGAIQGSLGLGREAYDGQLAIYVAAHRGLIGPEAPENSIEAIGNAIEAGASVVEIDVRYCKDGWIVFHDEEISPSVKVAELGLQDIQSHSAKIPSFEKVLSKYRNAKVKWLIDIKATSGEQQALELKEQLEEFGLTPESDKVILLASDEILEHYRDFGYALAYCAYLTAGWNKERFLLSHDFLLDRCDKLGPDLKHLVLPSAFLRKSLIQKAQSKGLTVWAYALNGLKSKNAKSEYKNWLALAVDGIIVDYLPQALELKQE